MKPIRAGEKIQVVIEFDEMFDEEMEVMAGLYKSSDDTTIYEDISGVSGKGTILKIDEGTTMAVITIDRELTLGCEGEYYLDVAARSNDLSYVSGASRTIPIEITPSKLLQKIQVIEK
jgi:hypothetical protein